MKSFPWIFSLFLIICGCSGYGENPMIGPGTPEWKDLYELPDAQPKELEANNPLRKQLFDQLRFRLNSQTHSQLLFKGSLKAFRNWAVFVGSSIDNEGKPVKFPPMDNSDTAVLWIRTNEGWQLVDSAPATVTRSS